jgi:hypothetical protein
MKKTIAVGAAVVAAALLAGSIGAASASASWVECGTVKGPAWTAYGKKGTAYKVSADKVSCAFAKRWVGKIVRTPTHGKAVVTPPSPTGWTCYGQSGGIKPVPKNVLFGSCGTATQKFSWAPRLR